MLSGANSALAQATGKKQPCYHAIVPIQYEYVKREGCMKENNNVGTGIVKTTPYSIYYSDFCYLSLLLTLTCSGKWTNDRKLAHYRGVILLVTPSSYKKRHRPTNK